MDVTAKADHRVRARARRAALDPEVRRRAAAAVAGHLDELLAATTGWVMTYAAIRDELDLGAVNERLAAAGRLALPRVEADRIVAVPAGGSVAVSRFGVTEPLGEPLAPSALGAVLVPGLAFDREGGRIGWGAGYYDRFLPELAATVVVAGVGFEVQIVDGSLPTEPHDVHLPVLVTERGILRTTPAPRSGD